MSNAETTTPDRYRFNDQTHEVYQYSAEHKGYLHIGKYHHFGLRAGYSYETMESKVDAVLAEKVESENDYYLPQH